MAEHDEQAALVDYIFMQYPDLLFFSVPNGANLAGSPAARARQMNKLKGEGLLPGTPDLVLVAAHGGYTIMFLEMKDVDGGNGLSDNQAHFLAHAEKAGAYTAVANGFDEAKALVDAYLAWEPTSTLLVATEPAT